MFSKRSAFPTTTTELARAKERWTELDLTVGNPTRAELPYDSSAILGALQEPSLLAYEPHALGPLAVREAIAKRLRLRGVPATGEHMFLTASTSEAYSILLKLLCDPGDDVLIPTPSYPLFEHLAQFESVTLLPYRLLYDGAWHVDLDHVRSVRTPRTRAIFVVSPNNPTGSFLKREEYDALAALGTPLVVDEVFGAFPLRPCSQRLSSVALRDDVLAFSLGGLSKEFLLPQMKLGFTLLSGPPAQVSGALHRLEVMLDAYLSVGAPVLAAAPMLMRVQAATVAALRQRLERNLETLRSTLTGTPASVLDVEGGFYATLRLPRIKTDEMWALELLEYDGVATEPGHLFGFSEEACLVVSLLTPPQVLSEGVERIARRATQ